ncbi:MAG: FlgD immunoglobulin-like domain containing protein [bacterium]
MRARARQSVTGLGLNWTLVKSICSGNSNTTVTATVEFGNTTIAPVRAAVIAVSRYSGVVPPDGGMNPIGNVISSNVGGITSSTTFSGCNGLPSNAYSFNLTTTVNGAVVFGAAAMKSRTHTPGVGYTEQAEKTQASSTYTSSIAVQDKTVAAAGAVTVNGSFNDTVDWAVVALEIKPQGAISKLSVVAENKSADDLFPAGYQLEQNYPNPFSGNGIFGRSNTLIAFSLPAASQVTVNIYNETGQLVRTLVDGEMTAGRHGIYWNGKNQSGSSIASGIYLYQIVARGRNGEGAFTQTKRMMLLK